MENKVYNWKSVCWGDLATLEYGKGLREYKEGNDSFPVYGTNGQIGWHSEYLYPKSGVIVGRKGAYRGIHFSKKPFFVIDTAFYLKPKDEKTLDIRWAYYQLLNFDINKIDSGSAIPSISREAFYAIHVQLPTIITQRKIAAILSAYDDLIENNLRRIKILEEMAQTLYREWFVKFRFPGHQKVKMVNSSLGKIPEGWEIKNLFELADVTYGFPFKASLFSVNREGTPVVRIRDVLDGQSATFTTEDAPDKYIVHDGDFLVGMDGDFHMGFWVGGTAFLVQRVARFRPRGDVGRYGLALALKEPIEHFNKTITGTTVAHLGDNHLRTINAMIPDKKLLKVINDILEPLLDFQLNIRAKNKNLRQTRDLHLPKLISGELDVSELDIKTGINDPSPLVGEGWDGGNG